MASQSRNLLIDLGNTRLKWGIGDDCGKVQAGEALLNSELNEDNLAALWRKIQTPHRIGIACVGGTTELACGEAVANKLWPAISVTRVQSQAENFGVTNAYSQPEQLGVDRWLGMIAAYHQYRCALCIAGCGTAVTVDLINADGQHLGGLICPGIHLMKESLAQKTENLSMIRRQDFPAGLADFTGAAIHNGVVSAIAGMIGKAVNVQSPYNGYKIVLTGGDAALIAPCLASATVIDVNLVLSGLALMLSKS